MDVSNETEQQGSSTLDIDSAVVDQWCRREFPIHGHGSRNVVQVVVKRSVLEAIRKHGLTRTDVEVCGVLVGNCYQDERGPFIYVEAMIQGKYSENQVAQVTFTSETWNHIQDELEEHHAEKRILGWYHTHPGFGIFLSAMDMFIHENFFNQSEQLALVYDPISGDDGLFVWHDKKAELHQYLVEEDTAGASREMDRISSMPALTAGAEGESDNTSTRLRRLERRNVSLWCLMFATLLFSIAWPFAFDWYELSSFIPASSPNTQDPDIFVSPRIEHEHQENEIITPLETPNPPLDFDTIESPPAINLRESDSSSSDQRDRVEGETRPASVTDDSVPE
ncbi:MAG: hypothetical protein COA78_16365 [Blastopirellula sp.]|nr:MAG: hypothetical protein COA78_16365 [Blastopirellula sp.]